MFKVIICGLSALMLLSRPALAQYCSTWPHQLQNGTAADANQVMDNFNCAAPTVNPSFSGSVGIGGAGAPITGYGHVVTNGPYGALLSLAANGTEQFRIQADGSENMFYGFTNRALLFFVNSIESMVIEPSHGWVGIGTNPVYTLDVLSSTGGSAFARLKTSSAANSWINIGNSSGSMNIGVGSNPYIYSNTGSFFIGADGAPALFVQGNVNGYVGIDTPSPSYPLHVNGTVYAAGAAGALSDIRHKKDIASLKDGALDNVMKLRPVSFQWKAPKDDGMKGRQMGFIAQEVEKVLPSAVLTQDDAVKTKGLKYNEIVAVLTKALQEQQAEIERMKSDHQSEIQRLRQEQQAKIDALSRKVSDLSALKAASLN